MTSQEGVFPGQIRFVVSSRRRHTRCSRDWSSDVCSSDLTASRLCGKDEMLKPSYSLSENGQDARVSMLTGRATSHKATLSTSKTYTTHMLPTFEPKRSEERRVGKECRYRSGRGAQRENTE